MYQGIYGEWYDDNGNPTSDPRGDQGSQQAAPPAYTIGNGPNKDKAAQPMPGYDAQHDPYQGSWQINDADGSWSWLPKGSSTTHQGDVIPPAGDGAVAGGGIGTGQLGSPASTPGFFPDYSFTPYSGFTPFNYDSYAPLTADAAAKEPGYDFARQQGRDAVQTSQAAKGNILSGAALKDLFAWGDQFAGQNYQNAEARNENVYTMNRGNAFNNWAANETGKYQQWQGNLQPAQFAASLKTNQGGLTLADLLGRFSTTGSLLGNIAAAGAK